MPLRSGWGEPNFQLLKMALAAFSSGSEQTCLPSQRRDTHTGDRVGGSLLGCGSTTALVVLGLLTEQLWKPGRPSTETTVVM